MNLSVHTYRETKHEAHNRIVLPRVLALTPATKNRQYRHAYPIKIFIYKEG